MTHLFDPLTPARLSEIRARAEAAIAGPWFGWHDDDGRGTEILIASKATGTVTGELAEAAICDVCAVDGSNADAGLVLDWGNGVNRANAEFIAHSRQDVPDLLDEVDRLTAVFDAALAEAREQAAEKARNQLIDKLADEFEWLPSDISRVTRIGEAQK